MLGVIAIVGIMLASAMYKSAIYRSRALFRKSEKSLLSVIFSEYAVLACTDELKAVRSEIIWSREVEAVTFSS